MAPVDTTLQEIKYIKKIAYTATGLVILLLAWGAWYLWNQQLSSVATMAEVSINQKIVTPDLSSDQASPEGSDKRFPNEKNSGTSLLIGINDSNNTPLSGATIVLRPNSAEEKTRNRLTRENGFATFENIAAGVYSYTVSAPPRPTLISTQPLRLVAGESHSVELQLGDYNRTITGLVLDQTGAPLSRVVVVARAFGAPVDTNSSTLRTQSTREAISGENGVFEISGLNTGAYQLRSRADEHYPSVQAIVGADVDSVVLRLVRSRRLQVSGRVTNRNGDPVNRARVLSLNQAGETVYSDSSGHYELFLFADQTRRQYQFRFLHDNYRETREILRYEDLTDRLEVSLDATLKPIGPPLAVYGALRDSYGRVIPGEQVQLQSPSENTSYYSTSDQDGSFLFPAIIRSADYRLKINPHGDYRDYELQILDLSDEIPPLELVLQSLATGRLSGAMVDSNGNPVPNQRIWIRSSNALSKTLKVSGDANGEFVVEQVPEGSLTLGTRSVPVLLIDGITIEADTEQSVQIIFDYGDSALSGQIVDPAGQPVPGARVSLHGNSHQPSLRASSTRTTTTDTTGSFNFSRLGAWSRRLDVSAAGYANWQQIIGSEQGQIEVRLASIENKQ